MHLQNDSMLIKSKKRVKKHGEVFTPQWVVERMISIPGIKEKTEDIFATFLEPSAGEGVFLLAIEELKFQYIRDNYSSNEWDFYALWVLSSIYGIEVLEDNLNIARYKMLELFSVYYEYVHDSHLSEQTDLYRSAKTIIWANIVQGNALTHKNLFNKEIIFSNWARVKDNKQKVQRTTFTYSSLFKNENDNINNMQINMFESIEQLKFDDLSDKKNEFTSPPQRYTVSDIKQVWKEEKENG